MATTLEELLAGSAGSSLMVRVMPDLARPVAVVSLLEDIASTDGLDPAAVVVLTRRSAESAGGYQLDVLVRRAAEHQVAALVLRRCTRRSVTAETLARRGGVALLDVADDLDPSWLLEALSVMVSGGTRESLRRLAAATRWIREAETAEPNKIVDEVASRCDVHLRLDRGAAAAGSQVEVDGQPWGAVVSDDAGEVALIAGHLAAAAISLTLTRNERALLLPVRSTAGILGQLLSAPQDQLGEVALRARGLGFLIDGWHCAIRLALENATDVVGATALALHELEDEVLALVARSARGSSGRWSATVPDDTIVLVRTTSSDPERSNASELRMSMEALLGRLSEQYPTMRASVGIGTVHQGATGLRVSAGEARTALASARLSDRPGTVSVFDSSGLRRMLAEWLVTDTARDTVAELLAPLDALGGERSRIAIRTLHAYLDERGSLQRAATRLHLHRNAVVYRMSQITRVLDVDLQDADLRFALQLACRARLLTSGDAVISGP